MSHILRFIPIAQALPEQLATVLSSNEMLAYMDLPRWDQHVEVAELISSCERGQACIYLLMRNDFVCGIAGLSHICIKHRYAHVTCGILPIYARGGLATEAMRRIENLAFDELGLHRLEAQVHENNHPCLEMLQRLGYFQEGRMRGNFFIYDTFYDSVLCAKINLGREFQLEHKHCGEPDCELFR